MNNLEEFELKSAVLYLEKGDLNGSEKILNKLLVKNPKNLVCLQLLAIVKIKEENFLAASHLLKKAYQLDNQNPTILLNLGKALLDAGRAKESSDYLYKHTELDPTNPNGWMAYGDASSALKNFSEAIRAYGKYVTFNFKEVDGYLGLANAYLECSDFEKSIQLMSRVISISSSDERAWSLLIAAYIGLGNLEKASEIADKALEINPKNLRLLVKKGDIELARNNVSLALSYFEDAIKVDNYSDNAWLGLGNVLCEKAMFTEALNAFEKALAINPQNKKALCSSGLAYKNIGDFVSAENFFSRSIAVDGNYPLASYNLGHINLSQFKFKSGWINYEKRWQVPEFGSLPLDTNKQVWDGKEFSGSLLIWQEQGIGDQILFGSILAELGRKVDKIIVQMDLRLLDLFKRSFNRISFISKDVALNQISFDKHISIGSLAKYYVSSAHDLKKRKSPYLIADKSLAGGCRQLKDNAKLLCGISWVSFGAKKSKEKTINLIDLLPILRLPHCTFIDVGYIDTSEERNSFHRTFGIEIKKIDEVDSFKNIDGLAAVIDECDFIVSGSNTSAHLSGALGKNTYLLAPDNSAKFWYWHDIEGKCLWYPTISIFNKGFNKTWQELALDIAQRIEVDYEQD